MGYNPQEQLNSSLGKNLSLYSLIRAWLIIALEALAHRELKWPKNLSHELSLIYDSSMILSLLSIRSRKCFPLRSDAWKIILHLLAMLSHSFFLLKSQDDLQENSRMRLKDFISLSTTL